MSRESLEKKLPHNFAKPELLTLALTHSSWANEAHTPLVNNERLEFLGDAVLELCVSQELFRRFPDAREGELTTLRARLVGEKPLAQVARELGLDQAILLGIGEERQGGRNRDSIISDALEAVIAAIYEDGGLEAAKKFVDFIFADKWPKEWRTKPERDYKSRLQELSQQLFKEFPVYKLECASGPEHAKMFEVSLSLADGSVFHATSSSCKKAEMAAAALALDALVHPKTSQGGSPKTPDPEPR